MSEWFEHNLRARDDFLVSEIWVLSGYIARVKNLTVSMVVFPRWHHPKSFWTDRKQMTILTTFIVVVFSPLFCHCLENYGKSQPDKSTICRFQMKTKPFDYHAVMATHFWVLLPPSTNATSEKKLVSNWQCFCLTPLLSCFGGGVVCQFLFVPEATDYW